LAKYSCAKALGEHVDDDGSSEHCIPNEFCGKEYKLYG